MSDLEMGKWVTVKAVVEKIKRNNTVKQTRTMLDEPKRMMYIGRRTIPDGDIEHEFADGGGWISWFRPKKYTRVLLLVESENRNPVYVLEDDISADNDSGEVESGTKEWLIDSGED